MFKGVTQKKGRNSNQIKTKIRMQRRKKDPKNVVNGTSVPFIRKLP